VCPYLSCTYTRMQAQRQPISRPNTLLQHFTDEIAKMEESKSQLNARYMEIFKICEINCAVGDFDVDGDDDILNINFAGRIVRNIRRSILTKPPCGWNLFSCLFHKRWDAFHPRDKEGRIYVDLEEEWISPLLDYMMYYQVPVTCLHVKSSNDIPFSNFLSVFQLSSIFNDEDYYPTLESKRYPVVGNDISMIEEVETEYYDSDGNIEMLDRKKALQDHFRKRKGKYSELKKLGFHYKSSNSIKVEDQSLSMDLSIYKKLAFRGLELLISVSTEMMNRLFSIQIHVVYYQMHLILLLV
jgi:hypothetical protein